MSVPATQAAPLRPEDNDDQSGDDRIPSRLVPAPDWGFGTGALPLLPDARDYPMERLPSVADMLQVGFPASYDLSGLVEQVYNQGALPSCVAHSTCGMKSLEDKIDRKVWNVYDAVALYQENGGNGSNGVDTRGVLQDAQANGVPLLSGGGRNRIGSYAFAPQIEGQFEATLKAAVAANEPCVLAVLLPTQFGWDFGGAITQAYHQMCLCGYDDTWAIFLNSWGPSFGQNGFCRLPWSYITQNNFQQLYAYAYTAIDALGPPPPPPPPPPPVSITVTGYGGTAVTASVNANASFSILGSGFDQAGNLEVSWGGQSLPVTQRTQNILVTTAPATPGVAPVSVGLGGQIVIGPMLPILPVVGPPPPPGDLGVSLYVRSYSDGAVGIWATVKDAAGAFVAATCTGTAGTQELPAHAAQSNGVPAVWMIQAAAGALITIHAVAADGRTGSGTATVSELAP